MSFFLAAFGSLCGILSVLTVLLILSRRTQRQRRRRVARAPRPFNTSTTETANWINLTLARIRSVDLDDLAMKMVCQLITDGLAGDPERPKFITNLRLSTLQPPTQPPVLSDFQIVVQETTTTLLARMNYRPSAVIGVAATASIGPAALQNLLHVNLKLEYLLSLIVIDLGLVANTETNALTLVIGNDFVVEMHSRPIPDEPGSTQTKYLEGMSAWIIQKVSLLLRGKKFPILALPESN
jgi:hypothetical protein